MKVKESEKVGLKLNIQKTKIMGSGSTTSWQTDGETMATVTDSFLGLQSHCTKPQVYTCCRASLVAQAVKTLLAVQDTWVPSLAQEDPLEKGMAIHSSILA